MPDSTVAYDVGSWRLGDDGCIHRRGRVRFSNGDVYEGEWVDGKRHGNGILRFATGSSYVGAFECNLFHGFGLLTIVRTLHPLTKQWIPGEKYDGEFRHGKKHGHGTYKTSKGETYTGAFGSDMFHGRGICVYANGDVYEGEWKRGKWHGHGEMRQHNGSTYCGDFVNGLFHGYGKYSYGNGGKHGYYSGEYRLNQRHGKGVRVFGDGKRYEGDWRDDTMNGVGMLEGDAFKYVGEFVDGRFHGHGVVSYSTGDAYEGRFVRGEFQGEGTYVYADGGRYVGTFSASKKHGHGRRVFSTGDWYEGEWQDDLMHGRGVLEHSRTVQGGATVYHYDGAFQRGEQTGEATIRYVFTPVKAETLFEWNHEYEFPVASGFWHCGRGASTYVGHVYCGAFHGDGVLESPDGRRWQGHWRHGKLQGQGHCLYLPLVHEHLVDNEKLPHDAKQQAARHVTGLYRIVRYDGDFEDNVRHGSGRVLFENGDWVIGDFVQGFANGTVLYKFSTGTERYAEYTHGQRVRWLTEQQENERRAHQALHQQQQEERNQRRVLRAMMA